MSILIFGHHNPDTDSITSTLALAHLKNHMGNTAIPCRLGEINKETKFVLDYFHIKSPKYLDNVKTQIKDLKYQKFPGILPNHSILYAYKLMEKNNIRTLPIVDNKNKLLGIVTMKDIAMGLIKGDLYYLDTTLENIASDLEGEILIGNREKVIGKISVIALYSKTLKSSDYLNENSIVIVGDRFNIVDHAIKNKVQLIIISGKRKVPIEYIEKARENGVSMIRIPKDTYIISKLINQCNFLDSIMVVKNIVKFNENEYLDEAREDILSKNHSNYPIVNDQNIYLGMMNKQQLLNPGNKQVILVDHNEYSQSARGLDEAEILEIIDHHKLGDISTSSPIHFRNMPLGSTCTIVYLMYKECNIPIKKEIAGLLAAGIISDTLSLKSPTTTNVDKKTLGELNEILKLDIDEFAMKMFKAGTSLEGQDVSEIFHKDYKAFNIENKLVGVAQVFTLDIDEIFSRKNEFLEYIKKIHQSKDHFVTLFIITDILKEGSYVLYESDIPNFISHTFNISGEQGIFIDGIVSRKKQVIPKIMQAINVFK